MKSKFFGFNAKLALALLAVIGITFTGCYESEGDDIPLPYNPPAPVYTIAGTVTDVITGKGIEGATVTFTASGATTVTVTTISGGAFSVNKDVKDVTYDVKVTKTDYQDVTGRLAITGLKPGQAATYMFNAAMTPNSFNLEGLSIITSSKEELSFDTIFDATKSVAVDRVNYGSGFMKIPFNITVDRGGVVVQDGVGLPLTRTFPDDLKAYILNYLRGIYGNDLASVGGEFNTTVMVYDMELAPKSSLKSITASTKYKTDTYSFTYNNETFVVAVKTAYAWEFGNTQFSNEIYHGHGHGHGHGGDLNAGGGIVSPIN